MKIILDTNVHISGLILPNSLPGKILKAWNGFKFDIAFSEPMLNELEQVLTYSKINTHLKWDKQEATKYVALIRFFAEIVAIDKARMETLRDPDDGFVLATLIASRAKFLVTGDKDLLVLNHKYPILTLAEFLSHVYL